MLFFHASVFSKKISAVLRAETNSALTVSRYRVSPWHMRSSWASSAIVSYFLFIVAARVGGAYWTRKVSLRRLATLLITSDLDARGRALTS